MWFFVLILTYASQRVSFGFFSFFLKRKKFGGKEENKKTRNAV